MRRDFWFNSHKLLIFEQLSLTVADTRKFLLMKIFYDCKLCLLPFVVIKLVISC